MSVMIQSINTAISWIKFSNWYKADIYFKKYKIVRKGSNSVNNGCDGNNQYTAISWIKFSKGNKGDIYFKNKNLKKRCQ
jgi:hypothetical protein